MLPQSQVLTAIAVVALGPITVACGDGAQAPPTDSTPSVWIQRTFESYASTAELQGDCASWDDCAEDLSPQSIFLDVSVAYGAAGLTRSMRYDWTDQGCQPIAVGRGIRLPCCSQEAWVELVVRWSTNFSVRDPACPPPDHRLLLGQVYPPGNDPWALSGAQGIRLESPLSPWDAPSDSTWTSSAGRDERAYFDEQWHVVRVHWRHSRQYDRAGSMQLWVDGELLIAQDSMNTGDRTQVRDGTRLWGLLLGRSKDQGVNSGTESLWIGRVRVWDTDPGW
jgi:hypothetical protein